jgi:hypothetical protein
VGDPRLPGIRVAFLSELSIPRKILVAGAEADRQTAGRHACCITVLSAVAVTTELEEASYFIRYPAARKYSPICQIV